MYTALFTKRAEKSFKKIPREYQIKIKVIILRLEENPYLSGTIKLLNYPAAQYRKRVGDYRILFDIEEDNKTIIIADVRRRTSTTYQ